MLNSEMAIPRYWRNQEQRYMGEGRDFIKIKMDMGVDEEGKLVTILGMRNVLNGHESWWVEELFKESSLIELGKEVAGWLEENHFNDETIKRVIFKTSLVIGKGGEDLMKGVLGILDKADGEMALLKQMRLLGFSRAEVENWIFSVNGYESNRKSDVDKVRQMLDWVYC